MYGSELEPITRLASLPVRSADHEPQVDETWAAMGRLRPEPGCSAATVRSRTWRAPADLRREVTR